nr:reverse transcriptase domain-containing protein [Tanacetum cinerariifolium]
MNVMYKAFTRKLKDIPLQPTLTNADPPVIEPWALGSEDAQPVKAKENAFVESDNNEPPKNRGIVGATPFTNMIKEKQAVNKDFYYEPYIFKESEKDVRDLVASPFTKRIQDYDMTDGIKVPTNLRAYDGTTNPDDHLTYDNLASGSIDGFHQLRDKFMANFLQQRRFQKTQAAILDLIAKPPASLEDLFTQTHNFIRAEDANNENRLRELRRETKQHLTYKDLPRRQRDKHIYRSVARHTESYKAPNDTFTALIKSPAEILATSEGKAILRPPPRMFAPANKRDRTKYYEFHEDHGHDTNDYDPIPENYSGDDPLIIKADVGITHIHRIYVDRGSSAKIMYEHCFEQLTPEEKEAMRPPTTPLFGFAGQISWPLGLITLPITIYDYRGHISKKIVVDFMIIRAPLLYNIILGRPGLMKLSAKKRVIAKDRSEAITMEVSKLVEARILKPVFFPRWVSNPVMVKKSDGTWRMCIDFTNLNKACPKDSYPLPEIDQNIESLEGFKLKCFLDAYKGYHQIRMAKEDEEKTSFHIEQGTFCYEKMPFGLKNSRATYQRLMDNVFISQLGRNIEIYVDDMVIKSKNEANLISDVAETFDTLRKANMKLNPKKCTFGVEAGQFLGYMITNEGIQANPKKSLPALTIPNPRETLVLYLTVATEAISVVLLADRGDVQKPIYFVSRALQGSEINYPNLEKVALALVHAARRLRRYFQAHTICVVIDQPIRQVLLKPENSGRLAKWAIELREHVIIYKPRSAIKGQILADFLAESPTLDSFPREDDTKTSQKSNEPAWTLFTDGASSIEGSGAWLILTDPDGREVTYALRFNFKASNNEAEYEALVAGLGLVIQMKAQQLKVYTDSLLIANQVKGIYEAREELMKMYLSKV